jgi:hypothetical protein
MDQLSGEAEAIAERLTPQVKGRMGSMLKDDKKVSFGSYIKLSGFFPLSSLICDRGSAGDAADDDSRFHVETSFLLIGIVAAGIQITPFPTAYPSFPYRFSPIAGEA